MKQYDFVRAWVNDADYDIEGPVVVLDLKELREVWEAGRERFRWEECGASWERDNPSPDFETYLQSKGITNIDIP